MWSLITFEYLNFDKENLYPDFINNINKERLLNL